MKVVELSTSLLLSKRKQLMPKKLKMMPKRPKKTLRRKKRKPIRNPRKRKEELMLIRLLLRPIRRKQRNWRHLPKKSSRN